MSLADEGTSVQGRLVTEKLTTGWQIGSWLHIIGEAFQSERVPSGAES